MGIIFNSYENLIKIELTVFETMWYSWRESTCVSHLLRNLAARILSTTVLVCWKQQTLKAPSVASLYRGPGGGIGAPTALDSKPAVSTQHSGLEPWKQKQYQPSSFERKPENHSLVFIVKRKSLFFFKLYIDFLNQQMARLMR